MRSQVEPCWRKVLSRKGDRGIAKGSLSGILKVSKSIRDFTESTMGFMLPFEPLDGSFLSEAEPSTVESIFDAGDLRRFVPGDVLFHQGDPSRHVVLVHSGWLKVTAVTRRGWEAFLALRGAGDIVGEMSAIDLSPRAATVTAVTAVSATVVNEARFSESLAASASLTLALLRHMTARLRESDARRTEFGSTSGHQRLIALLVDLINQYGRPTNDGILIEVPLAQRELAAAVGVSRQIAARTLRTLRERGVIVTSRQRIVVVRPDLLRSLVQSV